MFMFQGALPWEPILGEKSPTQPSFGILAFCYHNVDGRITMILLNCLRYLGPVNFASVTPTITLLIFVFLCETSISANADGPRDAISCNM